MMKFSPYITALTLTLLLSATLNTAMAQPQDPTEGRTAKCLDQFSVFMSEMLDPDSNKEYFEDLFVRNRCQQDDLFALDKQIESKSDELRASYFDSCFGEDINELRDEIHELKMEQYYIRHIAPIQEDTAGKKDLDTFRENLPAQTDLLRKEMIDRFSTKKDWFSEEVVNELFDGWVQEYESRVENYIECNSSPWQEVADKWKEFQEGIEEIREISVPKNNPPPPSEEEEEDKGSGEKNSGGSAVKGFFKNLFGLRINNLAPERGTQELLKDLEERGEFVSLEETQEVQSREQERYVREVSIAGLLAQYDLLYGRGSTDATNDLSSRIRKLIKMIDRTTKGPLHALKQAAKGLHEKQGKTSP